VTFDLLVTGSIDCISIAKPSLVCLDHLKAVLTRLIANRFNFQMCVDAPPAHSTGLASQVFNLGHCERPSTGWLLAIWINSDQQVPQILSRTCVDLVWTGLPQ
jgi:hypothetical protein